MVDYTSVFWIDTFQESLFYFIISQKLTVFSNHTQFGSYMPRIQRLSYGESFFVQGFIVGENF